MTPQRVRARSTHSIRVSPTIHTRVYREQRERAPVTFEPALGAYRDHEAEVGAAIAVSPTGQSELRRPTRSLRATRDADPPLPLLDREAAVSVDACA